ncbi:MAG: hypothetical protein ACR2F1_07265 [Nitrososphaeraceae archaeon]
MVSRTDITGIVTIIPVTTATFSCLSSLFINGISYQVIYNN